MVCEGNQHGKLNIFVFIVVNADSALAKGW